jgi:hypothetical protein
VCELDGRKSRVNAEYEKRCNCSGLGDEQKPGMTKQPNLSANSWIIRCGVIRHAYCQNSTPSDCRDSSGRRLWITANRGISAAVGHGPRFGFDTTEPAGNLPLFKL